MDLIDDQCVSAPKHLAPVNTREQEIKRFGRCYQDMRRMFDHVRPFCRCGIAGPDHDFYINGRQTFIFNFLFDPFDRELQVAFNVVAEGF